MKTWRAAGILQTGGAGVSVPDLVPALEGRLPVEPRWEEKDGAGLLFADGDVVFTPPLFEAQPQLDPKEGFTIPMRVPAPQKILAVYQYSSWWARPAFPDNCDGIPDRTQLLLLRYTEGVLCLLAVCGEDFRCDLRGGTDWNLLLRCASNRAGDCRVHTLCAAAAWDPDPYLAVHRAARAAAGALKKPFALRVERHFPAVLEGLGWCTWDAFYHEVNEAGILAKLAEFREKGIPVQWVLIDDGWMDADLDRQVLRGLDADRERFPDGLAAAVRRIKEYGVLHVGVWHAVMGYWCGLEKDSAAYRLLGRYCTQLPDGRIVPAAQEEAAFSFYDTWHRYLRDCGVDFVKVDCQSAVSIYYRGRETYGGASGAIQRGLERSVQRNFGGAVIHCMGMAPEEIWARPRGMVIRTSDDFVPAREGGFSEHAMQNAYCSLWTGSFYTGDWDMFFSDHPDARNGAALRAVSGGPVYMSDRVGGTSARWLRSLMEADGTIRRCEGVGLPTSDCLFTDPRGPEGDGLLKVWNRRGDAVLLAVFALRRGGRDSGRILYRELEALFAEASRIQGRMAEGQEIAGTYVVRSLLEEPEPVPETTLLPGEDLVFRISVSEAQLWEIRSIE